MARTQNSPFDSGAYDRRTREIEHARKFGKPATCECSDPGCPVRHQPEGVKGAGVLSCNRPVAVRVRRLDFAGQPKVAFCEECWQDAAESGVFG